MSAIAANQYSGVCGSADQSAETGGTGPVWATPVDVYETEKEFVVNAQLPGVKKEDLQIQLKDNLLTIKGSRQGESDASGTALRIERSHGAFDRSFKIPANIDLESIKSELSQGVLKVYLPKHEEVKPRQIEINVN